MSDVDLNFLQSLPYPVSIQLPDRTIIYENKSMSDIFGDHQGNKCFSRWFNGKPELMHKCKNCPFEYGKNREDISTIRSVVLPDGRMHLLNILHHTLNSFEDHEKVYIEIINDITDLNDIYENGNLRHLNEYFKHTEIFVRDEKGEIQSSFDEYTEADSKQVFDEFSMGVPEGLSNPIQTTNGYIIYYYKSEDSLLAIRLHEKSGLYVDRGYMKRTLKMFLMNQSNASCLKPHNLIGLKMILINHLFSNASLLEKTS